MDVIDTYQEIRVIKTSDYKKIVLVQSTIDNLYYIKRELLYYDKDVYLQLQQLNSLHIPNIAHAKEKEGCLIVIEEYINAPTLDSYITNQEIEEKQAIQIIKQLVDCLQVLHALKKPIIHRDIKPENIFYDRGQIILFDFDIARIYSDTKNKDTVVLGSVGYASPEQFGFGQSDTRSDIYALGVLLNVLLTKHLPQECLHEGKYKKIIIKATNVDRNNRYNSVEEFKRALNTQTIIIPGINNTTKKQKILSILGYGFIIAVALNTNNKGDMNIYSYYIMEILYMVGLEFLLCNQHLGIFNKMKNKLIKAIGVFISWIIYMIGVILVIQSIESILSIINKYFNIF